MLIEDKQGNQLLELLELLELDETALGTVSPLTHALVVARRNGLRLFVFNRYRKHWELAGGVIDKGETPRACAARELSEESGIACAPEALRFVAAMKFRLQPSWSNPEVRVEYGALYALDVSDGGAFVPNEEIAAVCWWNGMDEIGELAAIDVKLTELV